MGSWVRNIVLRSMYIAEQSDSPRLRCRPKGLLEQLAVVKQRCDP